MIIIEYIQFIFVFVGAIIIAVVTINVVTGQLRIKKLYRHAEKIARWKHFRTSYSHNEPFENSVQLNEGLPEEELSVFLEKVNITDMCTDPFLKEVVDKIIEQHGRTLVDKTLPKR